MIFYWREGDLEVDFVLQHGDKVIALEVKSGLQNMNPSGIDLFVKKFKPNKIILVGDKGIPVIDFIQTNIMDLME